MIEHCNLGIMSFLYEFHFDLSIRICSPKMLANKDLLQTLVLLLPNLKFEILKIRQVKYREIQKTYQKKACWHKDAENSFYQDDERSLQLLDCDSLQIQSMEPRT